MREWRNGEGKKKGSNKGPAKDIDEDKETDKIGEKVEKADLELDDRICLEEGFKKIKGQLEDLGVWRAKKSHIARSEEVIPFVDKEVSKGHTTVEKGPQLGEKNVFEVDGLRL